MLTYEKLVELERSLRGRRLLSVYVDGGAADPVGRSRWRHTLDRATEHARAMLDGASAAERAAFDKCAKKLMELLPQTIVALYPPGWVAFIEPEAVRFAGSLHVAPPTSVSWGYGVRVAPYLRALKQHQPAVAVVVDSVRGRIYRYIHGALERVDTVHVHSDAEEAEHMGSPPASGFHRGTRGRTATDEVERSHRASRAVMMRRLATRVVEAAGADGWVLLGGIPEAVRELMAALPEQMILGRRVRVLSELDAQATDARVAAAAERGATLQRRAYDLARVEEVIDHAAAGGRGVIRRESTLRALRTGAVQRLFLTERFLREHPDDGEELVRAAFDNGALVEQASGDAADRLDTEADGVGARLRYVMAASTGGAAEA